MFFNGIFNYYNEKIKLEPYLFGNPDDLEFSEKLLNTNPMELEHGYLLGIICFNWNSFTLILREMPLVLPLSVTLTSLNRIE